MANWVDFAEVRQRVSLEQVLFDLFGLTSLKRNVDKVVGPCPVHGGNSPRAFHADLSKNVWHCFSGCKRGGNQIDFVAAREGVSVREAALLLQRRFMESTSLPGPETKKNGTTVPDQRPPKIAQPPPDAANDDKAQAGDDAGANKPIDVRLRLKREHPHLLKSRGLSLATLNTFDVGYCSRGLMRGCIAIPIHNADGQLVAYAGRRLKPSDIAEHGKYKLPKGFRKDAELYNWHRAWPHVDQVGHVVVVEGFFSVMLLAQLGIQNVVATMGCSASAAQARLLETAGEVIVLFDGNDAGRTGATDLQRALDDRCTARVAHLPEHTEPEDLSGRCLRWLINGMRVLDLSLVC